tara:strand:+ start:2340 stop:2750 length:411 start_codon:yes stop_codon:yes gene_type:complete
VIRKTIDETGKRMKFAAMSNRVHRFDWYSIPEVTESVYCNSHFLSSENDDICVRFSVITIGNTKKVAVHFTGKTGEGFWQPWGAWEGCTLQGDSEEHARNIWNMIFATGKYRVGKPAGSTTAETRYKNSQWETALR